MQTFILKNNFLPIMIYHQVFDLLINLSNNQTCMSILDIWALIKQKNFVKENKKPFKTTSAPRKYKNFL